MLVVGRIARTLSAAARKPDTQNEDGPGPLSGSGCVHDMKRNKYFILSNSLGCRSSSILRAA